MSGGRLSHVTRHMLGLFHGRPGARQWRRILSVDAAKPGAGADVVLDALAALDEAVAVVAEPSRPWPEPATPSGSQHQPVAGDGVAVQRVEERHAEQALVRASRAGRPARGRSCCSIEPTARLSSVMLAACIVPLAVRIGIA